MFISAYKTLPCKPYNLETIQRKIKEAKVNGDLIDVRTTDKKDIVQWVLGIAPDNTSIPAFSHPILLEDSEAAFYVIDTRPYLKKDRSANLIISNETEYKTLLIRAGLNHRWSIEPLELTSFGDLPVIIFTRWLSNMIATKLSLDPAAQVKVQIVTLFFWYSLFRDAEFSKRDKDGMIKKLSTVSFIPPDVSYKIAAEIEHMSGVEDYLETLKSIVGGTRINSINLGLFYSMIGNSWFGLNSKEIIGVAVEHPPTFIAIILTALESRSYKKSVLGRLVEDSDRGGLGRTFTKGVYGLVR